MSDFGDLGDIIGTLGDPGANAYARGAIIAYGARNDISANQTLLALRSVGLGFQRAQFLSVFADYKDQIAAGQTATALPFDASSGELLTGTPPPNWTGQYNHEVTATFRTKDSEGNWLLNQVTRNITSNEPLSPEEATNAAMDILSTPADPDADSEPPAEAFSEGDSTAIRARVEEVSNVSLQR